MRYLLLIAIAACGYPEFETTGTVDAPVGQIDGLPGCPAPSAYGSPTLASQRAEFFPTDGTAPDQITYDAGLNSTDALLFGFFSGGPKFQTGFVPKQIQIADTDPEKNFSQCSACVLIAANCVNCTPTDAVGTADYYMATGGTLKLTTMTQTRITGTVTNLTFVHVTIANSGPNPTLISTPAADGCTTTVASAAFDTAVTTR